MPTIPTTASGPPYRFGASGVHVSHGGGAALTGLRTGAGTTAHGNGHHNTAYVYPWEFCQGGAGSAPGPASWAPTTNAQRDGGSPAPATASGEPGAGRPFGPNSVSWPGHSKGILTRRPQSRWKGEGQRPGSLTAIPHCFLKHASARRGPAVICRPGCSPQPLGRPGPQASGRNQRCELPSQPSAGTPGAVGRSHGISGHVGRLRRPRPGRAGRSRRQPMSSFTFGSGTPGDLPGS